MKTVNFWAHFLKTFFILSMLSKKQKHALLPFVPLLFKRLTVLYISLELWEVSSFQHHFIYSLDKGLQFVSFATFFCFLLLLLSFSPPFSLKSCFWWNRADQTRGQDMRCRAGTYSFIQIWLQKTKIQYISIY